MRAIVIGGGAAGFFGAIACSTFNPEAEVTLLEKTNKLLAKVAISGGGRCNVTNGITEPSELVKNYPRGSKELRSAFNQFGSIDTHRWFEERGVRLKTEQDGRIFPVSDNSQSIIDCLIKEARVQGVKIMPRFAVQEVTKVRNAFQVQIKGGGTYKAEKLLVATGGNPNATFYTWLQDLGHDIVAPVPSLFTFNVPDSRLNGLQGVSVPDAEVRVMGSKMRQRGPLLITHWGFSGPAVLKTSAWEARQLAEQHYNFKFMINWLPDMNEEQLRNRLLEIKATSQKNISSSYQYFDLPRRLWERFMSLCKIEQDLKWPDLSKKSMNLLIEELIRGIYTVKGKTTFKEEFVTAGGVHLKDVDLSTMESKKCSGLYLAGEVLDIDAITGGFNFQAAWTTGYIAGKNMANALYRI